MANVNIGKREQGKLDDLAMGKALELAVKGGSPKLLDTLMSGEVSKNNAVFVASACVERGSVDMLEKVLATRSDWPSLVGAPELMHDAASKLAEISVKSMIKALARAGISLDAPDYKGLTPLMQAAGNGSLTATMALLEEGADIELKGAGNLFAGYTPLMVAARYGRRDVAEYLLKKGARLDASTGNGETSLLLAAQAPNGGPIIELLLSAGAPVDAKDKAGKTAAIIASENRHAGCMQALIAGGADVDQRRKSDGKSLVEVAFEDDVARSGDTKAGACGEALIRAGARIPDKVWIVSNKNTGAKKFVVFAEMVRRNGYENSKDLVVSAWESQEVAKATRVPAKKAAVARRTL